MTGEITNEFIAEHGAIMAVLKITAIMTKRVQNGENVPKEHLEKVVFFLRNYADKLHHGKEEDILFPKMLEKSTNDPEVNELLGEHKTGRDLVSGMVSALTAIEPSNPESFHFLHNAEHYIALLEEHIRKENEDTFPRADTLFTDVEKAEIKTLFSEADKKLAEEMHLTECLNILQLLEKEYFPHVTS